MSEISFRRATMGDLAIIAYHRRRMFEDMGKGTAESLAEMEQHFVRWCLPRLEREEYIGQLACEGEQVIGGAGLWLIDWPHPPSGYDGPLGYLLNVFVEPEYRGKGIAKHCVVDLVDECRARKIETVRLHASVFGRPLYEKLGFVQTNEMGMLLN